MKRTVSISVKVIGIIIVGMLLYSIALFALINNKLISGFEGYIQNTLKYQSQGVQDVINEAISDLQRSTDSLKASFYEDFETRGFEPRFVNDICHNTTRFFDADGAIIVDTNGKKVTTTSLGSVDFSSYINRAIAGE